MAKTTKHETPNNELVLTPYKKRTRTVIKWQDAHETFTCSAFALFMDNNDMGRNKLGLVGRKLQNVFESIAQTIKDGKLDKDMLERRDNLELALAVANITNSNIIESLDNFINLFK